MVPEPSPLAVLLIASTLAGVFLVVAFVVRAAWAAFWRWHFRRFMARRRRERMRHDR